MGRSSSRAGAKALGILASLGLVLVACIDAPRLDAFEGIEGRPISPPAGHTDAAHPGMVFVSGVSVDLPGSVAPTSADPSPAAASNDRSGADAKGGNGKGNGGNGNGNGNGGGGGKGNGGGGNGGGNGDNGGNEDDEGDGAGHADDAGTPTPGDGGGEGGARPPGEGAAAPGRLDVVGFWIDAREVTVSAYRACVAAGGCTAPAPGEGCTTAAGLEDHPVSCLTYAQAGGYCAWQKKRLLKGDEWTAAAAGSALRPYPWGSARPSARHVNACGAECAVAGMYEVSDGHVRTAPVGSFPLGRTPEGVDDLAGNVAEWVEGAAGPSIRGGSFADVELGSVGSFRSRGPEGAGPSVGFRCAVSP